MICATCETDLPAGALFCPECGSSVAPSLLAPASTGRIIVPPPAIRADDEPLVDTSPPTCAQCGAELDPADIFCGVCGHLSRAPVAAAGSALTSAAVARPGTDSPRVPVAGEGDADDGDADDGDPNDGDPNDGEANDGDPNDGDALDDEALDDEATRIVSARRDGVRFVLQFSTGESVSVTGTGLVGRSPTPEPGEHFDALVRVADPTRSVSKTHLEFGNDSGEFWIRDRFSANGSAVRAPDAAVVRCDGGKRYLVARGSRIDMGEQFVVVS